MARVGFFTTGPQLTLPQVDRDLGRFQKIKDLVKANWKGNPNPCLDWFPGFFQYHSDLCLFQLTLLCLKISIFYHFSPFTSELKNLELANWNRLQCPPNRTSRAGRPGSLLRLCKTSVKSNCLFLMPAPSLTALIAKLYV